MTLTGRTVSIVCTLILCLGSVGLPASEPAPAWKLDGADGSEWSSESLKGNVVVLEFWATWCRVCQNNMPDVARLTRDYADAPVQVIAVSYLENADPVAYLESAGLELALGLHGEDLAKKFGVQGTPTAVVIDPDGKIGLRVRGGGEPRNQQVRDAIDRMLAEGR